MKKPQWLQDDLKIITQWWSTRIMIIGVASSLLVAGVAAMVPGYEMREWLGTWFVPAEGILFAAGAGAQFYRQRKLRRTAPDKAETMVTPDPKP